MITIARANVILDTEYPNGTLMSLHTAFSLTGANELTGGSYARQPITWAPAANRAKNISANVDFAGLPAAASVAWVGLWDAAGTTFKGMTANGGTESPYQIDTTNNIVIQEGHGFVNGDTVAFIHSVPTGLVEGTLYYVINATSADPDTFQVSATLGGSAVDFSGTVNYNARCTKVITDVYVTAGGTHSITQFTINS